MLLISIVFTVLLFAVLIVFSFPQLSPIPYFPSNAKDLPIILEGLALKNDQVLLDLGAGDGIVIFAAAKEAYKKKLNTQFIAIETNPFLLAILYVRRLLNPNKKNIHLVMKDLFKTNYKALLSSTLKNNEQYQPVIYLYISHWLIKQAIQQVEKTVSEFKVVSYFYPVPFLTKKKELKGKNSLFVY